MKFEKITDNKIKIVFSLEDMSTNDVSINSFFANREISQTLLQTIISKAEQELGFHTENHELLVEALATSEGGFEFTITKLCFNDNEIKEKNKLLFKFDTFDDFLMLYTYIKNMNNLDVRLLINNSSLFFYQNYYYLIINYDSIPNNLICILSDFSCPLPYSSGIDGIINEYGKIIFNNKRDIA